MYKTRLAQWGYVKNFKKTREIERRAAAVVQRERLRSGRNTSALQVPCRGVGLGGPGKCVRYRKVSEDDLLAEAAVNGRTSQTCPVHIRSVSPTAGREAATSTPAARRDPNEGELSPTQRYLNLSRCGSLSPAASSSAWVDLLTALEKPRGASLKAFTDTTSTWGPTLAGSPCPSDDFVSTGTRIIMTGITFTEAEAPFCDPIESDLSLLLERGLSPDSSNIYSGEPMDSEPGCSRVQQDLELSFGGGHSLDSLDLSCREPMESEAVDGRVQQDTRPLLGGGAMADSLESSRARPIEPRVFLLRSDNTNLSKRARGLDYHALAWLCQDRKYKGSNEPLLSTFRGRQGQSLKEEHVPISSPFTLLPHASSTSPPCDQMLQSVRTMALQVAEPANLTSRVGADNMSPWVLMNSTEPAPGTQYEENSCSKCHQAMSGHCISLAGLAPSTQQRRSLLNGATQEALTLPCTAGGRGEAWRWVAFCFGACIQLGGGDSESSTRSLTEAATVFEHMLTRRDDLVITALHIMVTILHMHNQSEIAESIVGSATAVARRLLKPEDPIRLTLEWEAAAAGLGLDESGLGSQMLRQVYIAFERERTLSHPWTIAALYNLAWMLLYEGSYAGEGADPRPIYTEAADLLQKVYVASCASLGSAHMQSITALMTLARAQSNLGEDDKAIETFKKAIHDCKYTLGRSHPFRLEAKRRLAVLYEKKGQKEKMEPLYWDVLRGRVTMLGRHHPWTVGMKDDLITLLKDLQKWEDNGPLERRIHGLFENATEVTPQHEAF
jgi:tetratricopeptide (TPR) repeat protein